MINKINQQFIQFWEDNGHPLWITQDQARYCAAAHLVARYCGGAWEYRISLTSYPIDWLLEKEMISMINLKAFW